MRPNRSFDADTHRQAAASRAREHMSRSGWPVRAGQLRRYAAAGQTWSASIPVTQCAALVGNSEDRHFRSSDLISQRVWEVPEVIEVNAVLILGPVGSSHLQAVNVASATAPNASAARGPLSKYQRNASRNSAAASGRTATVKRVTASGNSA